MKLEQLDQDTTLASDTQGVSIDGTGQIGTYFYTAPEIEQGWPKIDEKVVNSSDVCLHWFVECVILPFFIVNVNIL